MRVLAQGFVLVESEFAARQSGCSTCETTHFTELYLAMKALKHFVKAYVNVERFFSLPLSSRNSLPNWDDGMGILITKQMTPQRKSNWLTQPKYSC